MVGKLPSPNLLATDALFNYFDKTPSVPVASYIHTVEDGGNKIIWDDLQHQIYLGDDAFVERHQLLKEQLEGDVSEIAFKQRFFVTLDVKNSDS